MKTLSVPEQHQKKIALATLRMSDVGASIMGGMSKAAARAMSRKVIPAAPATQSERRITRLYIRYYRDNGQTMAYVEWSDGSRTEGHVKDATGALGIHMQALFDRGIREGLTIERDTHDRGNESV